MSSFVVPRKPIVERAEVVQGLVDLTIVEVEGVLVVQGVRVVGLSKGRIWRRDGSGIGGVACQ